MIKKKIQDAINDQIKHELYSAYYYLAMSAYCETLNLPGFAKWMHMQYQEETEHAMRLFNFLLDRDGKVELQTIDAPPRDFKSPLNVFESVLKHEKKVTALIHKLYELSVREGDYPTQVEMQWFITEQVEEEKNAGDIVEQIKLAGDNNTALLLIDRELGSRQPEDE